LNQYESISKQLSVEQERLQQDLTHLERDELLVSEERKEPQDAIQAKNWRMFKMKSKSFTNS
jgi:hypothetical protein